MCAWRQPASLARIHKGNHMRLEKIIACAGLAAVLAAPGFSAAGVITDVYDPDPPIWVSDWTSPFTYTHNLLTHGYVAGTPITSANIEWRLFDGIGSETVNFTMDGSATYQVTNVPTTLSGSTYDFAIETSLLTDGQLNVSVSVTGCQTRVFGVCILPKDVFLERSTLTVMVDDAPPANVPEPGTLFTLGIGMLGMAARRVRRG
jgi:hypothetical protein